MRRAMSCVYCEPKSRMRIFSACRSAKSGPPAREAHCNADRLARHGLLRDQDAQTRFGALEVLLWLAPGNTHGAQDGSVPADERRSQSRDDRNAHQLRDGVEEPGALLVHLRQGGAIAV